MLYCENNNNINRCESIYYLSNYINNQFKSNKYINIIIILLLILSNIVNGNKLYAEARDTDRISIIRSGEDPSCISQCDSINENNIYAGVIYLGDSGVWRCKDKMTSYFVSNNCNNAYAKETVCKGKLYTGDSSVLSTVYDSSNMKILVVMSRTKMVTAFQDVVVMYILFVAEWYIEHIVI